MTGLERRDVDLEALQQGRRGGCLDVVLVVSIIFLFVTVAALAAGGAMIEKELRSQLKSRSPTAEYEMLKQRADNSNPTYKMKNSIYLKPASSLLTTSTMLWAPVKNGSSSSVGINFTFDPHQSSLMPNQEGTYFIYLEFNLTCVHECNETLVIVQVGDMLTCEVALPAVKNKQHVTKKCWKVSHVSKQKFVTKMTAPNVELQNWRLEPTGSTLGLFCVD